MSIPPSGEITSLLGATRRGEADALDRLLSLVYPTFRSIATNLLSRERVSHTLQPTALVHEAVIRLFLKHDVDAKDRTHLMALAGRQMRHILIEHARARLAERRGSGKVHEELGVYRDPNTADLESLLQLNDLLNQLREEDPRAAEIVDLRFFAGLSREEIAERLNLTVRTVQRDWEFARAWFLDALKGS